MPIEKIKQNIKEITELDLNQSTPWLMLYRNSFICEAQIIQQYLKEFLVDLDGKSVDLTKLNEMIKNCKHQISSFKCKAPSIFHEMQASLENLYGFIIDNLEYLLLKNKPFKIIHIDQITLTEKIKKIENLQWLNNIAPLAAENNKDFCQENTLILTHLSPEAFEQIYEANPGCLSSKQFSEHPQLISQVILWEEPSNISALMASEARDVMIDHLIKTNLWEVLPAEILNFLYKKSNSFKEHITEKKPLKFAQAIVELACSNNLDSLAIKDPAALLTPHAEKLSLSCKNTDGLIWLYKIDSQLIYKNRASEDLRSAISQAPNFSELIEIDPIHFLLCPTAKIGAELLKNPVISEKIKTPGKCHEILNTLFARKEGSIIFEMHPALIIYLTTNNLYSFFALNPLLIDAKKLRPKLEKLLSVSDQHFLDIFMRLLDSDAGTAIIAATPDMLRKLLPPSFIVFYQKHRTSIEEVLLGSVAPDQLSKTEITAKVQELASHEEHIPFVISHLELLSLLEADKLISLLSTHENSFNKEDFYKLSIETRIVIIEKIMENTAVNISPDKLSWVFAKIKPKKLYKHLDKASLARCINKGYVCFSLSECLELITFASGQIQSIKDASQEMQQENSEDDSPNPLVYQEDKNESEAEEPIDTTIEFSNLIQVVINYAINKIPKKQYSVELKDFRTFATLASLDFIPLRTKLIEHAEGAAILAEFPGLLNDLPEEIISQVVTQNPTCVEKIRRDHSFLDLNITTLHHISKHDLMLAVAVVCSRNFDPEQKLLFREIIQKSAMKLVEEGNEVPMLILAANCLTLGDTDLSIELLMESANSCYTITSDNLMDKLDLKGNGAIIDNPSKTAKKPITNHTVIILLLEKYIGHIINKIKPDKAKAQETDKAKIQETMQIARAYTFMQGLLALHDLTIKPSWQNETLMPILYDALQYCFSSMTNLIEQTKKLLANNNAINKIAGQAVETMTIAKFLLKTLSTSGCIDANKNFTHLVEIYDLKSHLLMSELDLMQRLKEINSSLTEQQIQASRTDHTRNAISILTITKRDLNRLYEKFSNHMKNSGLTDAKAVEYYTATNLWLEQQIIRLNQTEKDLSTQASNKDSMKRPDTHLKLIGSIKQLTGERKLVSEPVTLTSSMAENYRHNRFNSENAIAEELEQIRSNPNSFFKQDSVKKHLGKLTRADLESFRKSSSNQSSLGKSLKSD